MEVRKGYKQTEVGVIPEDWIVLPMDSIGEVIRGASPRPQGDKRYYGGNIPRLMVEDITRDKHWITPSVDYLTEAGAKLSRMCKKSSLVLVCSGTPKAVGLPGLLAVDACIHDGILGLVKINENFSEDFLFHQLRSLQQRLHAAATHGGTFVNLTTDAFSAFNVAIPPKITEQTAIATALSDADALITGLEKLIAKKRAIKQGTMQELLTGKKRLEGFEKKKGYKQTEVGMIPEDWDLYPFGDVFNVSGGLSASRSQLSSDGYCYLHYGDIHTSTKNFIDVKAEFLEIPKLDIPKNCIPSNTLLDDGDIVFVDAVNRRAIMTHF